MSTLSKVFAILLAVFGIAFTMSVISFVVQTSDWRDLANQYRDEHRVVEAHMRNLAASHAAEKAAWLDLRKDLDSEIKSLEKQAQQLTQEKGSLASSVAELKTEKSGDEALARKLAGEVQVAHRGWEEARKQRNDLDALKMDLERRNLGLSERVDELTTQLQVMTQHKKQLDQQINILRKENDRLAKVLREPTAAIESVATGPSMRDVRALTGPAGSAIRGRIVEVDGKLASISVGSADGVETGTVFVIYRGSAYIGDLKVTDVEPHQAAGRITRALGAPRAGDAVADEARFGLSE